MISESTLSVILWGTYGWFIVGFLLIAVPAVKELAELLFKKK